jgi:hypothetical protein
MSSIWNGDHTVSFLRSTCSNKLWHWSDHFVPTCQHGACIATQSDYYGSHQARWNYFCEHHSVVFDGRIRVCILQSETRPSMWYLARLFFVRDNVRKSPSLIIRHSSERGNVGTEVEEIVDNSKVTRDLHSGLQKICRWFRHVNLSKFILNPLSER